MAAGSETINNHAGFIWSVADLLRGDYKQSEYGRVILPFTVLRRFDCVLEPVKEQMLERYAQIEGKVENFGPILDQLTDTRELWNTSPYDLPKLLNDPDNLATNLKKYIAGFSDQARDILDRFGFAAQINRLEKSGLLYLVTSKFVELDLGSERVGDIEMGYLYEELIRRFSELSNETAGEHFTPRDVIRLMVELLLYEDDDLLSVPGTRRTIFDPACGTGGMLSVAQRVVHDHNQRATLTAFGQELNDETYATCRSDMMVKGQDASNIASGNSFSEDGHAGQQFDYLLSNPPFGVEWKKVRDVVQGEHESLGFGGRFGAGTPRINDGSLLFLQHMISKFKPAEQGGSRLAIVFNGSPTLSSAARCWSGWPTTATSMVLKTTTRRSQSVANGATMTCGANTSRICWTGWRRTPPRWLIGSFIPSTVTRSRGSLWTRRAIRSLTTRATTRRSIGAVRWAPTRSPIRPNVTRSSPAGGAVRPCRRRTEKARHGYRPRPGLILAECRANMLHADHSNPQRPSGRARDVSAAGRRSGDEPAGVSAC